MRAGPKRTRPDFFDGLEHGLSSHGTSRSPGWSTDQPRTRHESGRWNEPTTRGAPTYLPRYFFTNCTAIAASAIAERIVNASGRVTSPAAQMPLRDVARVRSALT